MPSSADKNGSVGGEKKGERWVRNRERKQTRAELPV